MKHIPLMNRGTSGKAWGSNLGRQLLVDDDDDYCNENAVVDFSYNNNHIEAVEEIDGEGTECVIDTRTPKTKNISDTTGSIGGSVTNTTATNRYDDTEYHPPMCGQLFITKVIGHNGGSGGGIIRKQQATTKELRSPRRSYNRRSPVLRLNRSKKNQVAKIMMSGGEYHETFSAEQSPDSDSETSSVKSYNDRVRILSGATTADTSPKTTAVVSIHDSREQQHSSSNRSCGGDSDTTSSLPSHIVQFDPSELDLIKIEKEVEFRDKIASKNSTITPLGKHQVACGDVAAKNLADAITKSLPETTANQSSTTATKSKKGGTKQSTTVAATLSSFPATLLPTVAEEKSFDLIESPSTSSAAGNYHFLTSVAISKDQNITTMLPTASSTSSSGDEDEDESAFFGCHANQHGTRDNYADSADADDDEIRDDRDTIAISQFGCFTPLANHDKGFFSSTAETSPNHNSSNDIQQETKQANSMISDNLESKNLKSKQKDSPDMMEILVAMRQIILKQQDAIQAISDENVEFRNQLAMCHHEMKTLQNESSDQLIQITQLVIQKNSMDVETTQLKDELARLKDEILSLKSDDADLVNRFASLMNNNDDTTDDDTTIDKVDRVCMVQFNNVNSGNFSNEQQRDHHNISPLNYTNDQLSDNESWHQILGPYDSTSSTNNGITNDEEKQTELHTKDNTGSSNTYNNSSLTEEPFDFTIVDVNTSSSTNSASIAIETILPNVETATNMNSSPPPTKIVKTTEQHQMFKDKDVAEFKNRLGEIQKKRMMRVVGSSASKDSSNNTDTGSKDRKTLTVRFL